MFYTALRVPPASFRAPAIRGGCEPHSLECLDSKSDDIFSSFLKIQSIQFKRRGGEDGR